MSNLSELLPTGGGQNAVDFVASGTLSSGQTVALKTDGTVVAISATGSPQELGTPVTFTSGTSGSEYNSVAYDTANNKIIVAYKDNGNSNYGTAIVGTVSGASISFGTPVVFESAHTAYPSPTYDASTGKIVIAYQDLPNSQLGKAIVGTVSGTSISFGSPSTFSSGATLFVSSAYDSVNNKVVIAYQDYGVSGYGRAVVATVSGTSVSFGSSVTFESAATEWTSCVYSSTDEKIVISYKDSGNSSRGTSIVGTVSGTSISFGTAVVFNTGNCSQISSAYDSVNNKVVIAFYLFGQGGRAVVGTVSGTSISFGSVATINGTAGFEYSSTAYATNTGNVVVSYKDVTNSNYATLAVGTVSGTSVSFATPVVIETVSSNYFGSAYDSTAKKIVIAYRDNTNPFYGRSVVFAPISSNSTDFIGITDQAIANTATGAVNVYGGINEAQSGLTIGSDYYVQGDGSLSTATSAVKVGQAISATTINMKDLKL
jgi:hypothetical protein